MSSDVSLDLLALSIASYKLKGSYMRFINQFIITGLIYVVIFPFAAFAKTSISVAYGEGDPDHLYGSRVAIQDYWPKTWSLLKNVDLSGYWDYSLAYWHTQDKLTANQRDNVSIIALAPVFHIEGQSQSKLINPFFEASVGASWMNHDTLGHRNLGAKFAFQDLLGVGFNFGTRNHLSLSYHFLHYSNANLFSSNEGIDIRYLLTLRYSIA